MAGNRLAVPTVPPPESWKVSSEVRRKTTNGPRRASKTLEKKLDVREAFLTLTGSHARSFPSWLPALQLDRVYYRGLQAQSAKCLTGRPWSELSDHIALYVELKI